MVFKKAVWASIAALVLVVNSAMAQTPSGTISGRVLDATGLSLPGVTVTLQGADITQTFTTDGEGHYRFLELAPGTYKVTAALQGFATLVRENVVLDLGKTVNVPVAMQISAVTETITVTAPSPMVDAKQTGIGAQHPDRLRALPRKNHCELHCSPFTSSRARRPR